MAASQNPLQGSLFSGDREDSTEETEKSKSTPELQENLTNEQLKADALIRPRLTKKTINQIPTEKRKLESNDFAEIEETKWSHHSLPAIEDLTPALKSLAACLLHLKLLVPVQPHQREFLFGLVPLRRPND